MTRTDEGSLSTAGLTSVTATVKFGAPVDGRARYDSYQREKTNMALTPETVEIYDARPLRETLSLGENGFELVDHRSEHASSTDVDVLDRDYHADMIELVRTVTGAAHVLPQRSGLLLRRVDGTIAEKVAKPAGFAHLDYTEVSAATMADLVRAAEDPDGVVPAGSPFAIVQTWRAVSEPEHDSMLALCDGRTVQEPFWMVADSVIGPEDVPGNSLELRLGTPSPDQRWFYFSGMNEAEVLVFNGFDSRKPNKVNVLHTSFRMPDELGPLHPRASIEARFVVYFD
ncbi:CmcJ/NvfI family oxidoreductase [Jatrophihabitans sp.]|uniref:CmcJ/NvfI family oxidoreductase n=1 Tax=Jatrophihabitans sp. TaxID=1932789 RepID=UPI0030C6A9BA|nr:hypothetical protein [Jatrophihabitans sp.]